MRVLPARDARYWTAISLASVFGANAGDFVSHDLHLGHWRGLLPLAALFAVILLSERRSKFGNETYYWLAVVTLRTAATNLADLATHDFKLAAPWVLGGLTALLSALLLLRRPPTIAAGGALPATTARYWTALFVAGTLGTALGDTIADLLGLGTACLVLAASLAGMFALRSPYWLLIVAIRTTGTTFGDASADAMGLPLSTLLTGLIFIAWLLPAWSPLRRDHRLWGLGSLWAQLRR